MQAYRREMYRFRRCIYRERRGEERRGNERVRLDLVVTYVESVVADLSCILGLL